MSNLFNIKSWDEFKKIFNSNIGSALNYIERVDSYVIIAHNHQLKFHYMLAKSSADPSELSDFEVNYKDKITISGKLKTEVSSPDLVIAKANDSSATAVKSLNNKSGILKAFLIDYDGHKVMTSLKVDGEVIFNVSCETLDQIKAIGSLKNNSISWDNESNSFIFKPDFPIKFRSSISIEAKGLDQSNNKVKHLYVEWLEV